MLSQNAISLYIPSSPSSSSLHKNTHSLISSLDFTEEMQRQEMGFREYIEALEEERKKIQVFPKELPLSLELITQAIEACRQQFSGTATEYNLNGQSESSEQTSMEEGPILEEFIPIKKRVSPDCEEEDEQHSHKAKISKDNNNNSDIKRKSDWLRSVQLWNPDPPAEEELPRKAASVVEVKRYTNRSGAFQPFHRDESVGKTSSGVSAGKAQAPSSSAPVAAKSSAAAEAVATDNGGSSSKREEKEGQRKHRRCWSEELHKRFLQALQQLGGADCATPKQIRELMKVDGLTNDEVKSHLQKFRLHTRRPSPIVNNNANPQTAPFVLVGNIFVQPPEYATTVATSAASGELTTVTAPTGVYAPVAAHPSPAVPRPHTLAVSIKKPEFKKVERSQHSHSEERANNLSQGAVHSNSPASSTSTHTTTTSSHGY